MGWESIHSESSGGSDLSGCSGRDVASGFLPRRMATSSGIGVAPHSSLVCFRKEACWGSLRGPCTFGFLMPTCREHLLGSLTLQCRPAAPGLRSESSPASWPGNPLARDISVEHEICGSESAKPGWWDRPHDGPVAAWMLLSANGAIGELWNCWGLPLLCGCPFTLSHWLLAPSTSEGVQSFPSVYGSTNGGG